MKNYIWVVDHSKNKNLSSDLDPEYYKYINLSENKENSINYLNRFFSEYCAMYYVWKNNIQSDIVSFCHYRRIINNNYIDINEILQNNAIQYYFGSTLNTTKTKYNDYLSDYGKKNIINKNYKYYNIAWWIYSWNAPEFLINDISDYLSQQKIIPQKTLKIYTKEAKYIPWAGLEIFSMSWENFCLMNNFIWNFIKYIDDKYLLELDEQNWKKFYKLKILPHYRLFNIKKYREFHGLVLYGTKKEYMEIYSIKHDLGYNTRCNVWRIFSYIIEVLINLFIICNINIMKLPYNETVKENLQIRH